MRIHWEIKKKRGNFRPGLHYTLQLEDYEKKLAIHAVGIETQIPVIPNWHQGFCLPDENERQPGWHPTAYHYIQVPYFKTGRVREYIRLPFREDGCYPEVEAAFKELRTVYETEVKKVYAQSPIEETGSLGVSQDTGKQVAAKVTADRLLALFGRPQDQVQPTAA